MTDRVADLGSVSPLFVVSDVEESAACYQRSLGFELRALLPTDAPFFAIVGRGQAQICLKQISPDVPAIPNRAVTSGRSGTRSSGWTTRPGWSPSS